jgi:MarR family transcriptional regulator, organic hydroperoxide resistance regulator
MGIRRDASPSSRAQNHGLKVLSGKSRPLTVLRPELLVDGSDIDFRRLVNALLPFLGLHTAIRNGYAELLGLTGPAYSILLVVRTLGDNGPVNIRTIADQLRLSGSFITAETNLLEAKNLVRKRKGFDDKRLVSVTLTPKGTALLDSIAELRQRVNDVQFGRLSREEFKALVPAIEGLVESSGQALNFLNFLKKLQAVQPEGAASVRQRGRGKVIKLGAAEWREATIFLRRGRRE